MSKSSRHHYVPQFYLRGFTLSRDKKSKIQVIDKSDKRHFSPTPINVGVARDFNRIDAEGIDPDILEKNISQFESIVPSAIIDVEKTRKFEGNSRDIILQFLSMVAIRNPLTRESIEDPQKKLTEVISDLLASDRELFNSHMNSAGFKCANSIKAYISFRRIIKGNHYKIKLDRGHSINVEMENIKRILPSVFSRKWTVLFTNSELAPFITSDNPVMLYRPVNKNSPPLVVGFKSNDISIIFPLSKKAILIGREFVTSGKNQDTCIENSCESVVAFMNARILDNCQKQVYASTLQFPLMCDDDSIINGEKYIS